MKIAIISDTHGNVANFRKIVDWLNKENIQTILHCGDIGSPESLKESLADFKGSPPTNFDLKTGGQKLNFKLDSKLVGGKFFGVFGNMDKDFKFLIEEYNKIPRVKINEVFLETEIGKRKIAITHFPSEAKKLAESSKYDLVFYGHTHRPWEEKIGNCRLINPGESAGQFYKPTFAIFDTDTDNLGLKILEKLG